MSPFVWADVVEKEEKKNDRTESMDRIDRMESMGRTDGLEELDFKTMH